MQVAELLAIGESGLLALLPLMPFTQDGKNIAAAEAAGKFIQERAPQDQVATLTTLLGVFAARVVGSEAALDLIRRLLMSNDLLLEVSPLYQQWVQEWKAEGREEGLSAGLNAGLHTAVTLLWRGRFGEPIADVAQAIIAASVETLNDILTHAATDTPDQLRGRLGL